MPLTPREQDNLTRWDESKKGFYEVWYLKWNDPAQGIAAWLRYTLLAPLSRDPEVSVWGIFFDSKDPKKNVAIKKTYPLGDARIEREIFYFAAGPSAIFDSGARGELAEGQDKISWELKFENNALSLRPFPSLLYLGNLPKTKLVAPYLSTKISGEFVVNDRSFSLQAVPAHQAHLWGTEMADSWVWGNCNAFEEDPDFCFEGLSANIKVGNRLSPPMTLLFFYWEAKLHRFNSPLNWVTNRSRHELDRWHFEAGMRGFRFVGDLFSRSEEMVGLRYEDPSGSSRFCHNTKVADLKIEVLREKKSGWECVKTFNASKTAAFEVVQPNLDRRVRLWIP